MVALNILFSSLLVVVTCASPLPNDRLQFPKVDPKELLCQLPIVKKYLCPRTGAGALNVQTVIGIAHGTQDPTGASRFTVKYASANRWAPSTVASTWSLP